MQVKNLFKHWTYQVFSPGTAMRSRYEAFQTLLEHDLRAHELMAGLEAIYHEGRYVDLHCILDRYHRFNGRMAGIVQALGEMCPARYTDLEVYRRKFDAYIRSLLAPPECVSRPPYRVPLDRDALSAYAGLTGGKAQKLARVAWELHLPVPRGFVLTTRACNHFLEFNGLREPIRQKLARVDILDNPSLEVLAGEMEALITEAELPPELHAALNTGLAWIAAGERDGHSSRNLAVRSSARGEDGRLTFAGQYRSLLNVAPAGLAEAYKKVLAGKYTPRSLFYRISNGILDEETPMAVLVLEMVAAGASGVMYTREPDTARAGRSAIHALWGLGELLVGGAGRGDLYRVEAGGQGSVTARVNRKTRRLAAAQEGGTELADVDQGLRDAPVLEEIEIRRLARWGARLETHFGEPQDVEWCRDQAGRFFILQSRPLAKGLIEEDGAVCTFEGAGAEPILKGGEPAAPGAGAGPVKWVRRTRDLAQVPPGAVLAAPGASPAYVPLLDRVRAVVTGTGSAAGHFASVAREFGVPALVNVGSAIHELQEGEVVTVHPLGRTVYRGEVPELMADICARGPEIRETPLRRRLKGALGFISQLDLVDPRAPGFKPEGCRSLHDILRFAHEKAVQEMFAQGRRRLVRKQGARQLDAALPMKILIMDVGGGIDPQAGGAKTVTPDQIRSRPFTALWQGLTHPSIDWSGPAGFDWAAYDEMVMGGGIISPDSALFASYAVISRNYLNFALKFGYHFVIVDALRSGRAQENYIMLRFAGGGADLGGRTLRTVFLKGVLEKIGMAVNRRGDLIDARADTLEGPALDETLTWLGRLLGATRLMDMHLQDQAQAESYIDDFFAGRLGYVPG